MMGHARELGWGARTRWSRAVEGQTMEPQRNRHEADTRARPRSLQWPCLHILFTRRPLAAPTLNMWSGQCPFQVEFKKIEA